MAAHALFHSTPNPSTSTATEKLREEASVSPAPMAAAVATTKVPSLSRVSRLYTKALMVLLYVKPVGDSVLCLCIASAWLLAVGAAAADLGRAAWGSNCAVAVAGAKVVSVSRLALAALCFPALQVFVHRVAGDVNTGDEDPAIREYVEKSLLSEALEEVLCRTVILGMKATVVFILLQIAGALLKWNSPVKGSGWERVGSEICVVGALALDALQCFGPV